MGYDLTAYRQFVQDNPVEVDGVVRLNNLYDDPQKALQDQNVTFWKDGQEVPITMVPTEMLTPETVAILAGDGTMHILLTPQITGSQEAIEELREVVAETDLSGGGLARAAGIPEFTHMDKVSDTLKRVNSYLETMDYSGFDKFVASLGGATTTIPELEANIKGNFSPDTLAPLTAYVSEMVAAIKNGDQLAQEDYANLQKVVELVNGMELAGVGENVVAGIGDAMAAAGWENDAESVATNLENALNAALVIQSPSKRMKPVGENVAAGVGEGVTSHSFATDAAALAANLYAAIAGAMPGSLFNGTGTGLSAGLALSMRGYSFASTGSSISASIRSAVSANLTSGSLRSIGVNAMSGLRAGINAGRSSVVSAMRSAASAAVQAAKARLKIASPSGVFRDEIGVMTMRGFGQGVLQESKRQQRTIQNATRFLTDSAKEGSIAYSANDNRRTYNTNQSVNLTIQSMQVRDEQDIRSLAVEIAALTRRQQRGRGLRFA